VDARQPELLERSPDAKGFTSTVEVGVEPKQVGTSQSSLYLWRCEALVRRPIAGHSEGPSPHFAATLVDRPSVSGASI